MTAAPEAPAPAGAGALAALAADIGRVAAGPSAADVDARARFPEEALSALRGARLLAVFVPQEHGGLGGTLTEAAAAVTALSRHCGSSAMVWAMHLIQVACLSRHGGTPEIDAYLERVAAEQLLLASATSEVGIGGDVRSSGCAVEVQGERYTLTKQAPTISYGAQADGIAVTARRTPDSAPSDQVLVMARAGEYTLTPTSVWDPMGFRGTCSPGFTLTASGSVGMVCRDGFGDISAQTMLPVSHVLWGAVWLGIAQRAAEHARRFTQSSARKSPGATPPGALRLAELTAVLTQFESLVSRSAARWDELRPDPAALSAISFAVSMNALKVSASSLVVDVVTRALGVCGMAGYSNSSPYSIARLLRDAHGAALMVNNDRILANTAQLVLGQRDA